MSPVTAAPPGARALRVDREDGLPVEQERRSREPFALFAIAYAFYLAVGIYATLGLHIVVGDAEARLAQAYFVWWDDPGKLVAIGFYWPPLQTLVLLPFALVKPLAISLAALPASSALFAALLVVVVDRAIALAGIARAARWSIVAAFALNPVIVFYAGNGMAESLYLLLLAAGMFFFVRWWLSSRWQELALTGVAFGLGVVSRYELAIWFGLVVVGVALIQFERRRPAASLEAALLVVLVPATYALVLWTYLTGAITGDPFSWFTALAPRDEGRAGGFALGEALGETFGLHLAVFPPTLVLAALLLVIAVRRRHVVAGVLGAGLLVDAFATLAFLARSGGDPNFSQLRYNIRAIPLTVVALGFLLMLLAPRARAIAAVAAACILAAAVPATALTMTSYENALGEGAFLEGVLKGQRQDAVAPPHGTGTPVEKTRETARFIRATVTRRNAILTDNANTYGVMLATGRPDLFLDRIDISDRRFERVAADPRGRVRYMLVRKSGLRYDLLIARYPGLRTGVDLPEFVTPVFDNGAFALYRVLP